MIIRGRETGNYLNIVNHVKIKECGKGKGSEIEQIWMKRVHLRIFACSAAGSACCSRDGGGESEI